MALKDSQKTMYQHSEVKIELLRLYLERYLSILSNSAFIGDIHLYDLFCGEGIYENGGKGSPIIILETIKNTYFAARNKREYSSKFHCWFNDFNKEKIEKLSNEIKERKLHHTNIGDCVYTTSDYKEVLPTIINKVSSFNKEKAFVFIDPYGYKEISINDIYCLLKNKKTEVLLFLPTQFMFRFEDKSTPESLKVFIEELIPKKEDWPKSETGIDFIETLKSAFRKKLGIDFFVDSFIITRDKNQFFCLFFFTSHIYGFEKMLEAKWQIDEEEGRGWHYDQDIDLFSDVEKLPCTDKFYKMLLGFIKEKPRTNGDVYYFTLHNGFLPKHATQILVRFQNDDLISVEKTDGTKARKSSFYINFKDYRDLPKKISIKAK
jgi:three-Cys-motif partner protein